MEETAVALLQFFKAVSPLFAPKSGTAVQVVLHQLWWLLWVKVVRTRVAHRLFQVMQFLVHNAKLVLSLVSIRL